MPSIPKRKPAKWEHNKRTGFQEDNRKTDERYHSVRWRKLRKMVLSMNPLCVMCEKENIVTTATDVDHHIPAKHDSSDEHFYNIDNLKGLCGMHHKAKSATERGRTNAKKTSN